MIYSYLYPRRKSGQNAVAEKFPPYTQGHENSKVYGFENNFTKFLHRAVNFLSIGRQVKGIKVYTYENISVKL